MAEAEDKNEGELQRQSSTVRKNKFGNLQKKLERVRTEQSGAFTPTRGDTEGEVQKILTEQLARWISYTCTIDPPLHHDNLFENLQDGIILCQFTQILTGVEPKSKLHSRKKCAKSDLLCHDNVIQFLDMIEDYSIPEVRFDSIQLVESKNLKAVNNCLLYFSVELAKRGMMSLENLPEETKRLYDKWLKKSKKKKKKKKKAISPPVAVHIDEVENPTPFADIVYQENGGSDSNLLEEEYMTMEDLSMEPLTDDEGDSTASDAAAETQATDGGAAEPKKSDNGDLPHPKNSRVQFNEEEKPKPKPKKKKKKKRRRTAYGFTAKDELDKKIMDVFDEVGKKAGLDGENSSNFGGIAIKKLRKSGEFQFGDSKRKTYIRENNGKLFVRIGGGWEELKNWMERKIKRSTAVGNLAKANRLAASSDCIQDNMESTGKVGHMGESSLEI